MNRNGLETEHGDRYVSTKFDIEQKKDLRGSGPSIGSSSTAW